MKFLGLFSAFLAVLTLGCTPKPEVAQVTEAPSKILMAVPISDASVVSDTGSTNWIGQKRGVAYSTFQPIDSFWKPGAMYLVQNGKALENVQELDLKSPLCLAWYIWKEVANARKLLGTIYVSKIPENAADAIFGTPVQIATNGGSPTSYIFACGIVVLEKYEGTRPLKIEESTTNLAEGIDISKPLQVGFVFDKTTKAAYRLHFTESSVELTLGEIKTILAPLGELKFAALK